MSVLFTQLVGSVFLDGFFPTHNLFLQPSFFRFSVFFPTSPFFKLVLYFFLCVCVCARLRFLQSELGGQGFSSANKNVYFSV